MVECIVVTITRRDAIENTMRAGALFNPRQEKHHRNNILILEGGSTF
jgi:hypothetical protein